MTSKVVTVKLAEVLKLNIDSVEVNPAETYQFAGVYSFGRGLFYRGPLVGSETTYKKFHRLHENQFVMSQVKGWEGALARVTNGFEGYYLSPVYPTFSVDPSRLDISYLENYFKQRKTWDKLERLSTGMGARRNSVYPDMLFSLEIPLPSLDEQCRIVAHIEALAARIAEARGLRQHAEAEALLHAARQESFTNVKDYKVVYLESVCAAIIDNLHSNPVYVDDGEFPCIRSPDVGWGTLFLETAHRTDEAEYKRRTVRGEPTIDDIVVVREGGGTGKAAIVASEQKFSLGQRVMMIRPNKEVVLPKYFLHQILSPLIYEEQILSKMTGSASPHLNIGDLRKFNFILPNLYEQYDIVAHLDDLHVRINALKRLQAETTAELDALLPAVLDRAFQGELT